ncbi:hypothetical protein C8N46_101820 [Kordia periserrulae]|uniref:Uncharacterized protein n=1 Tax=Kordia periserrulae TaxID=701523 RepID=A0A2T6C7A7_9FLAO|nr:hypothetical protein [Kordia periserrulae]PTX64209.1 hypothetical protein C8N46_101820 [Kordia periserrulae]
MKKKKLKNLVLLKRKISNLQLLYKKIGGTNTIETETEVETNPSLITIVLACPTEVVDCISQNFTDCATNGGTVKAPPPTEYHTCNCNQPGL